MEPHAALAYWEDGRLVVIRWRRRRRSTPADPRPDLRSTSGASADRRATHGRLFGCKVFPRIEPQVAVLSYLTGRPVKLVLDRYEEFLTLTRHATVVTIRLGLTCDGRITAKRVEAYWSTGAYADCRAGCRPQGWVRQRRPYRIPHVAVDSCCVYTNLPPAGAFRGYAVTEIVWASERMMDIAADALGLDPLEFRLRNLLTDGDRFATGESTPRRSFPRMPGSSCPSDRVESPSRRCCLTDACVPKASPS